MIYQYPVQLISTSNPNLRELKAFSRLLIIIDLYVPQNTKMMGKHLTKIPTRDL